MSSSISSTEQVTTSTAFEWTGPVNASPSRKRANGVVVGTNLVPDPETTAVTYWTAPGSTSRAIVAGRLRVTPSGTAVSYVYPLPTADVANAQQGRFAASPGQRWTARAEVTNPNASATMWVAVGCAFYNDQGGQSGAATQLAARVAVAPGATVTLEHTGIVPPDATTPVTGLLPLLYQYGTAAGAVAPASLLWESTHWQVEIGTTSPTVSPYRYFTGATPGAVVTDSAISRPLQVLGYESQRASGNVFHDVIGRANPDVTLRPAGLRTGTLSYLFGSEADAAECERMHSGTAVLTLDDPELPTIAMPYVADGTISRQLDPQSRALWLVGVAYREVRP